jgi:hypothetical protein
MDFVVLHPLRPAQESRYDGPVPRPPALQSPLSPLLGRLAAESRARLAARRRRLAGDDFIADHILRREQDGLTLYRSQAVRRVPRPW